jgi:carboxymethylenebutenolidase
MTALAVLEPNYVQGRQIEPDDKRLKCERIEFNCPNGPVKAYVAKPKRSAGTTNCRGVLVIHENRGLNEHIEDVTRRTALADTSQSRPMDCRRPVARTADRRPRVISSPGPTVRASRPMCWPRCRGSPPIP